MLSPAPSPAPVWLARYTPRRRLGQGGGGEVWEVEDAIDGRLYALKVLEEGSHEGAAQALVRECAMHAGLEGLGVPQVRRFGRLPGGRMFLLRDRVEGPSLAALLGSGAPADVALGALVDVSALLTRLHRAGVVHGDIKPDNVLLDGERPATLVDLGLAARWQRGAPAAGLTPGYAAPELRQGAAPSPRSDVFALGATLRAVIDGAGVPDALGRSLAAIADRACAPDPAARWPSVDEVEAALREALGLPPASAGAGLADAAWPVVERPALAHTLLSAVDALGPGQTLAVEGRAGAGKTSALRRLAWTLGVSGRPVGWVEGRTARADEAVAIELQGLGAAVGEAVVLVDDAGLLGAGARSQLAAALGAGARLVVTSGAGVDWGGPVERAVGLPPLPAGEAAALLRRARPSLGDAVATWLAARAGGRPGRLRALAGRLGEAAVVSVADAERLLAPADPEPGAPAGDPAGRAAWWLDRGRLTEAEAELAAVPGTSLQDELLRVRLQIAQGDGAGAAARLEALAGAALAAGERRAVAVQRARAALLQGRYDEAARGAREALGAGASGPEEVEALACAGVADSLRGRHEAAAGALAQAVAAARRHGDRRGEALALSSLALSRQRRGEGAAAREAYEQALEAAEEVGDAAAVATIRLNLAALTGPDELAQALGHLEAAVDLGQRAGRASTVRQARLNLASLDLSLGRLARARHGVAALQAQRASLAEGAAAQLLGLEATLAARAGDGEGAARLYARCAAAYDRLGRASDAAEARLEAILVASDAERGDPDALGAALAPVRDALAREAAHHAPLALAEGLLALRRGDEAGARLHLAAALAASEAAGQRDWRWQALAARARLEQRAGRRLAARHDAELALALLEDGAAALPPDLREVYWDDPRRRAVRELAAVEPARPAAPATTRPLDDRLERILEINRDLAGVRALPALLERVLHHAVALLDAQRGHVLLLEADGQLAVRASLGPGADEDHRSFSRSIAARAIATGEPVVTASARDDERLREHASVHLLALRSVACVPIRSPLGGAIGALHLEPRSTAALDDRDLSLLRAFADQAAIALEGARLLDENQRRADELARANRELHATQERLRELLDHRQAQLASTRRDLKDTRAVLRSHFGYQGLVGTSAAMRRVYALIERLRAADVPVLLTGESGTGKEMVARAIHDAGPRHDRPFVAVNCGAIPENLLESELFGHVKGAFTGAERDRRGLLRDADGGTVLLDEIGEMPPRMQAALLRVLQERTVRPVGGQREEPIDVRVIAATHRDLAEMVRAGAFREDLYFRLHVVEITIPPLRERTDDIPALVDHFLQLFAARHRRDRGTVSREALRRLAEHDWPGNVRQLQNVLLNAWVLADGPELGPDDIDLPSARPPAPPPVSQRPPPSVPPPASLSDHKASEKERILAALQSSNWNRVRAAQVLGIPRRTFYRRLRDYGIQLRPALSSMGPAIGAGPMRHGGPHGRVSCDT